MKAGILNFTKDVNYYCETLNTGLDCLLLIQGSPDLPRDSFSPLNLKSAREKAPVHIRFTGLA